MNTKYTAEIIAPVDDLYKQTNWTKVILLSEPNQT